MRPARHQLLRLWLLACLALVMFLAPSASQLVCVAVASGAAGAANTSEERGEHEEVEHSNGKDSVGRLVNRSRRPTGPVLVRFAWPVVFTTSLLPDRLVHAPHPLQVSRRRLI